MKGELLHTKLIASTLPVPKPSTPLIVFIFSFKCQGIKGQQYYIFFHPWILTRPHTLFLFSLSLETHVTTYKTFRDIILDWVCFCSMIHILDSVMWQLPSYWYDVLTWIVIQDIASFVFKYQVVKMSILPNVVPVLHDQVMLSKYSVSVQMIKYPSVTISKVSE